MSTKDENNNTIYTPKGFAEEVLKLFRLTNRKIDDVDKNLDDLKGLFHELDKKVDKIPDMREMLKTIWEEVNEQQKCTHKFEVEYEKTITKIKNDVSYRALVISLVASLVPIIAATIYFISKFRSVIESIVIEALNNG